MIHRRISSIYVNRLPLLISRIVTVEPGTPVPDPGILHTSVRRENVNVEAAVDTNINLKTVGTVTKVVLVLDFNPKAVLEPLGKTGIVDPNI